MFIYKYPACILLTAFLFIRSPAAYNILTNVSKELAATTHSYMSENDVGGDRKHPPVITEATVLLSFFIRSNIGIIPRASSSAHQKENSPVSITAILSHLTSLHIKQLEMAIKALMKGEALHASISFMNSLPGPIQIHWIHPETEEEVLVSNGVHSGAVEVMNTHPNHRFVAYDTERGVRREFRVTVGYGEQEHFHVEL